MNDAYLHRQTLTGKLRDREAKYRTLFDHMAQGVFYQGADGSMLDVNSQALELLGISREEFLQRNSFSPQWKVLRENGSELPGHLHPSMVALSTGRAVIDFVAGVYNPRRDSFVWLSISAIPQFHPGEAYPYQVITTLHDITDIRHAQLLLNQSEEKFKRIYNQSPVGIEIYDTEGRLVDANPAVLQIFGVDSLEDIRGFALFADPNIAPDLRERMAEGHPVSFETEFDFELVRRLGLYRPTRTGKIIISVDVALFSQSSRFSDGYLVYVRDISEIRWREAITKARLRILEVALTHNWFDLTTIVLDEAEALTGSSIGFFHFLEPDQKTLTLQNWSTRTLNEYCQAEGKGLHYPVEQAGVWSDCIQMRRAVIHNNYLALPDRRGLPEGHAEVRRLVSIPILRGDDIVAIIGVGNKEENYSQQDVDVVMQLADLSWDVIERKRAQEALEAANRQLRRQISEIENLQASLRELSLRDPLTGLYNRRYLDESLPRELERCKREQSPLCVIEMDIDHFKKINDTYGHQTGDVFLTQIARTIARYARGSDIACRYGGEEFLLVLPGAPVEVGALRAEELRQHCAAIRVRVGSQELKVTLSFGVAVFPEHGAKADELVEHADRALYASKRNGRNRISVWEPGENGGF